MSGPYKPTTVLVQVVEATDDSPADPEHTTVETPTNMSPGNKAQFLAEKEAIHMILTGIGDDIYSNVDACQTAQEMSMFNFFNNFSQNGQAQRDKDMQKNLALIAKYFNKIYKPTNNNLRTSSNSKNKNVDTTPRYKNDDHSRQFGNQRTVNVAGAREKVGSPVVQQSGIQCFNCREIIHFSKECKKPKRVKDFAYHTEKMLLCKQAEQGEVPTADSGTDSEPVEHVQNDAGYNVFSNGLQHSAQSESISNTCLVETNNSNVTPDSPDMCEDDIQNEQNDVESDDERVALAKLIANLKLDVNKNKKIQKQLKKANTTLAQELKECKVILAETSKSLRESISVRDSCLVALQTKQTEFKKYKAFNDRTVDYDKLECKLNEALGQLAQKDTVIREGLKTKAYELLMVKEKYDELVKQSLLTKSHYEGFVKQKTKVISDLKLIEEHDIEKMLSMEKQLKFLNEVVYKRSQSIQTIHMMAPKVSTYNGRPTFANPRYLKQAQSKIPCLFVFPYDQSIHANGLIPDREETLALERESRSNLNKDLVHQIRPPTAQDMEILIQTCLMPLAIKTQNDSFKFVHELKQEMHADLKYVESIEKEIDELESDKAEFSDMYDRILQDCVSKYVMCSYLMSLSDLDALDELQCVFLHKVKECDCLAQKLSKQTESISKKVYTELLQRFANVEKHSISLEITLQKCKEHVKNDTGKGKSMDTKFDRPFVVRQPNAQRIPKPSVVGKPALISNSLDRICFLKIESVSKTNVSEGLSKPVTAQTLPQTAKQAGNDLLTGNRGSDLYTISLQESTSLTLLCLMAKATPTQALLWHRRLSHFNFKYINFLLKKDIVIGLPKLKYVKDQICSSCELSKAKRSLFKSKAVPSSKGRLNLLHMDLCGPVWVASINRKKYILVIVDDYSRYAWTLFLHSKDETPKVLKDFLTMIQRNLQAPVITVRTDRGTEFLNKTLNAFFKEEGIEHQTSITRTPEHNSIVKRQNRTLVEAARSNPQDKQPSTNIQSTSAPSTHTNVNAKENNNDQVKEGEQLQDDEFTNPLCTPAQEETESSSHNIGQSIGTPMATKPKLDADLSGNPVHQTDYHSRIGSLMYLTSSRPDIVQAVCFCARYQSRLTEKHLKEVKRIFRYLRGTVNIGLWYPKGFSFKLTTFSDADHARCIDSCKSTYGGIQFLGDKLVSWMSKKQNCTAMSLAEAEYVALSASCAQVMWMRTQL
uniref:Ribonuclease H-like domain-containing protein n=1 Tax=Tanacetum cinerariifolium TaxID=118510 RepID=A0A699HKB8_TANCI|nr:ribonuclease H-like domain-containing protein [Tanacetum cinerariifolium]